MPSYNQFSEMVLEKYTMEDSDLHSRAECWRGFDFCVALFTDNNTPWKDFEDRDFNLKIEVDEDKIKTLKDWNNSIVKPKEYAYSRIYKFITKA